ncbi:CatB-related O-acetyltransferase [Kosakonia pseudosacchari]|uniref:CatB-related O-acetyltransferase n=1 Tax=Kosakonia pseudosacchari TaxID=1646340 RepID=UPI000A39E18F|nr:CatB-related O-acetyltransferase [Kosakonia pseudosacchari]
MKAFFKALFLKVKGYNIHYSAKIHPGVSLSKKSVINSHVSMIYCSIDDYSYISNYSSVRDVSIGKFCSIGRHVKIGLGGHPTHLLSTSPFIYKKFFLGYVGLSLKNLEIQEYKKTVIGNDVWIGDNVIIPGGITVGDGVIIATGAVVTRDLEPYGIYAGIPAKKIGQRKIIEKYKSLIGTAWWDLSDDEIRELINNNE